MPARKMCDFSCWNSDQWRKPRKKSLLRRPQVDRRCYWNPPQSWQRRVHSSRTLSDIEMRFLKYHVTSRTNFAHIMCRIAFVDIFALFFAMRTTGARREECRSKLDRSAPNLCRCAAEILRTSVETALPRICWALRCGEAKTWEIVWLWSVAPKKMRELTSVHGFSVCLLHSVRRPASRHRNQLVHGPSCDGPNRASQFGPWSPNLP